MTTKQITPNAYRRPDARRPLSGPAHAQLDAIEQSIDQALVQAARIIGRELGFRQDQLLTHGIPHVLYQTLHRVDVIAGRIAAAAVLEDSGLCRGPDRGEVLKPGDIFIGRDNPGAPPRLLDDEEPPVTVRYRCEVSEARMTPGGFEGECVHCGLHEDDHPVIAEPVA